MLAQGGEVDERVFRRSQLIEVEGVHVDVVSVGLLKKGNLLSFVDMQEFVW